MIGKLKWLLLRIFFGKVSVNRVDKFKLDRNSVTKVHNEEWSYEKWLDKSNDFYEIGMCGKNLALYFSIPN